MDILIPTITSAVFKGREMYAIDNPMANFDNYQLCANQGIQYRTGNSNTINEVNFSQVSEQLQIEIVGKTEYLNYKILNCLGQTVKQWSFAGADNQKLQSIDVSSLNNGLYILQGQDIFGKVSNQKFIFNN
jgi:hypothetical protein